MSGAPKQYVVTSGVPKPVASTQAGNGARSGNADVTLALLGAAFLVVGITDATLLWTPLYLGNPSWEYATSARTLDGVPMPALGAGLLAFRAIRDRDGTGAWIKASAVIFGLMTLGLLFVAALLITVVPAILAEVPVSAVEAPGKAAVRHVVQAITYPVTLGFVTIHLWRTASARD